MKYGFLGCGNMGGAIANAISKVTKDIFITDRSGRAEKLAQEFGITYSCAVEIAQNCDALFLAVKPQMMSDALAPITHILQARKPLIITMAAGLTMHSIEQMVGTFLPVIRIMPNTPVSVGAGLTLYCANSLVTTDMLNQFLTDMQYSGKLVAIDEKLIDSAGVISGCGPAYMYIFADALADGAVTCGVSRSSALEFAAATLIGAGKMLLETGKHPGELKDAVCSPGGSTIAGINVLEENGFRSAVIECVKASCQRNKELGK